MIIKLAFEQFPASDYAKKGGKKSLRWKYFLFGDAKVNDTAQHLVANEQQSSFSARKVKHLNPFYVST